MRKDKKRERERERERERYLIWVQWRSCSWVCGEEEEEDCWSCRGPLLHRQNPFCMVSCPWHHTQRITYWERKRVKRERERKRKASERETGREKQVCVCERERSKWERRKSKCRVLVGERDGFWCVAESPKCRPPCIPENREHTPWNLEISGNHHRQKNNISVPGMYNRYFGEPETHTHPNFRNSKRSSPKTTHPTNWEHTEKTNSHNFPLKPGTPERFWKHIGVNRRMWIPVVLPSVQKSIAERDFTVLRDRGKMTDTTHHIFTPSFNYVGLVDK